MRDFAAFISLRRDGRLATREIAYVSLSLGYSPASFQLVPFLYRHQ